MISSDRFRPSKEDPGTGYCPRQRQNHIQDHTGQSSFHFSFDDCPKKPRFHARLLTCPWSAAFISSHKKRWIALFTVNFSHLHYNVFEHGCEAISGRNCKIARNCLASTFKNIIMQMRKGNCEKGYWAVLPLLDDIFGWYNSSTTCCLLTK